MVCLFSACVLAALVVVTQNGTSAFAGGASRWPNAAGQEPTAGNTKTPNGEKPKVITDAQIPDEDADEGELEPAALDLDQSGTTQLIQELYQATRLTKEKDILEHLNKAQTLIASGTDIKGTDAQGRTALHWAVFGSSYSNKPSTLIKYEEIADSLVAGGVEINKEDIYQDTALDYSLYAPTFEIQTLLIEHGASSGFLAAYFQFFNDRGDNTPPKTPELLVQASRKADLSPGHTLSLRLDGPVYSDRSRTGDPISATVTYPLCKSGEDITCPDGELVVPPGTKVNGTVLFATKAPDKYSRPRMVLDFSNILHKDGTKSPLYARVIDVDNARETVRNNEILGIVQPHAGKKTQPGNDSGQRGEPHRGLYGQRHLDGVRVVDSARNYVSCRDGFAGADCAALDVETEAGVDGMEAATGRCGADETGSDGTDADGDAGECTVGSDEPDVFGQREAGDRSVWRSGVV